MLRPPGTHIRLDDAAIGSHTNDKQNGEGCAEPDLHRPNGVHFRFHLGHPWNESGASDVTYRRRPTVSREPAHRRLLEHAARTTHRAAAHIGLKKARPICNCAAPETSRRSRGEFAGPPRA